MLHRGEAFEIDTLRINKLRHIEHREQQTYLKKLAPKSKLKFVKKICTATPSFVLLYNANCKLCHCMQKNKADNTTAAQSILSPMCLPGPSQPPLCATQPHNHHIHTTTTYTPHTRHVTTLQKQPGVKSVLGRLDPGQFSPTYVWIFFIDLFVICVEYLL